MSQRAARLQRARGALLGRLVGEALGATTQHLPPESLAALAGEGPLEMRGGGVHDVAPGQVTGEGELTLTLARELATEGSYERERVAVAYVRWGRSEPFDVPQPEGRAFPDFPETPSVAEGVAARADREARCAGALARVVPLAVWGWDLPPGELGERAAADARLSHPDPSCRHASVALCFALARAIERGGTPVELQRATLEFAREANLAASVQAALQAALGGAGARGAGASGGGASFAPSAPSVLGAAFQALVREGDPGRGLSALARQGGAADVIVGVAGALYGGLLGEEALPGTWREGLLACRTTRGLTYQTADLLPLAEALARA